MPCLVVTRTDTVVVTFIEDVKLFLLECSKYGSVKVILTDNETRNILEIDLMHIPVY